MGINITNTTNNPGISLSAGTVEGPDNFDNWTYNVNLDEFEAGDTITITGDWGLATDPDADYDGPGGPGYFATPLGPAFGTIVLDEDSGNMAWSFTYEEAVANAGQNLQVFFGGKYSDNDADGDLMRLEITCFLTGTRIATPDGEVCVEDLSSGDMVSTADGRAVPVRWVGRKTIKASVFISDTLLPVRVAAGALGNGVPAADLYLSANHGLIVEDMLVNAGALVNGDTIRFVPLSEMPASFTYYHVETEKHDEILANGAKAETFVDYIGRRGFDNYDEYVAQFGGDRLIHEMKRPRISSRRQLPKSVLAATGAPSFARQVGNDLDVLMAKLKAA